MITQEWFNGQLAGRGIKKDSGTYEDYQEGRRVAAGIIIGFGKPQLENELNKWVMVYVNYNSVKNEDGTFS